MATDSSHILTFEMILVSACLSLLSQSRYFQKMNIISTYPGSDIFSGCTPCRSFLPIFFLERNTKGPQHIPSVASVQLSLWKHFQHFLPYGCTYREILYILFYASHYSITSVFVLAVQGIALYEAIYHRESICVQFETRSTRKLSILISM